MKKIKLLVVLYKETTDTSETILSLKRIFSDIFIDANFELFLWDNSPSAQDLNSINSLRKECVGLSEVRYHHDATNKPLSYVYNAILDLYENDDYLIILDQDSSFDKKFIDEFLSVIRKDSPELILPIINFKETIVSPSIINYMKGHYYQVTPYGYTDLKHLSAINSGMIIALGYIRRTGFRYHKDLINYCTDDYFMREFRKNGHSVFVLKYKFEHDLSLSTLNDNSSSLKQRYKLMKQGRYVVYSDNIIDWVAIRAYFLLHKVYMAIKYKDKDYLKV
ncbi:glycosyltransferase [Lelliottia sp. WAP21]|uniref:glycosyltransferase n=1 Tax=Lelliottia sp. WAP21 TaxID=2877426 RepID=UPI001E2BA1BE|nr:glycosyltransferase [Lelliottia sp. WAP21]